MFHKQTENKIFHDVLIDGNKCQCKMCNWVCAIATTRLLWFIWKSRTSPESWNLRFWLLVFSVFFNYSLPHWKIGRVPVITDIHLKRKNEKKYLVNPASLSLYADTSLSKGCRTCRKTTFRSEDHFHVSLPLTTINFVDSSKIFLLNLKVAGAGNKLILFILIQCFLLTWEQVDALLMKVSFLWVDVHRPAEYLYYQPDFKLSLRYISSFNSEVTCLKVSRSWPANW